MSWTVCLDFSRPLVWLVPVAAFASAWVKGTSGVGEAVIYTLIWQLAFLAGVPETEDLGTLAALICTQQAFSTAQMAILNYRTWLLYLKPGALFACSMMVTSPVGNVTRENVPSESIRVILAAVFFGFAVLKEGADGAKSLRSLWLTAQPATSVEPEPAKAEAVAPASSVVGHSLGLGDGAADAPRSSPVDDCERGVAITEQVPEQVPEEPQEAAKEGVEPAAQASPKVVEEPWWLRWALVPTGLSAGFLGGLAGLNGPPWILMAAFSGLNKELARTIFPMGQMCEVFFIRLPILTFWSERVVPEDAHLYVLCLLAGQVGLRLGNAMAPRISQKMFERSILSLLVLSSLSILGIMEGHPRAISCLAVAVVVVVLRVLCNVREKRVNSQ